MDANHLFRRDQPQVTRLFPWGPQIIAQGPHAHHWVDLSADRSLPVASPGDRFTVGLATHRRSPIALARDVDRYFLFTREGVSFRMEMAGVPTTFRGVDPRLVAGDGYVVLAFRDRLVWRFDGKDWRTTELTESIQGDHYLIDGDRILIGVNRGEFGGALRSVDIESGRSTSIAPVARDPVHAVERDANGRVWVAQGLSHLGGVRGSLHVAEPDGAWTLVAASSNLPDAPTTWGLPPSSFDALAFSPDGTLHLVGGSVGLVRFKEGRWEPLIADWQRHVFATCLHMVRDDLALIGQLDAGVLVADLASRTMRRIEVGWSYYSVADIA